MKAAIIGPRNHGLTYEQFDALVRKISFKQDTTIVSGGAKGIDSFAEEFARKNNIPTEIYKPDYSTYGRIAPIVRNNLIAESADMCIAFVNDTCKGTLYTIKKFEKLGKFVYRIKID